jgi:4'-phosphopantetheinyl transferase
MLTQDSVHVWRVRLDTSGGLSAARMAARTAELRGMLSVEEQRKADAFRTAEHRREYILAHAALRSVLGHFLKISPVLLDITARAGTKPVLSPARNLARSWPDLRFNLSHTRGAALIGVTQGRELGVDIEWQRPMDDLEAMARSVMSEEELELWKALEAGARFRAFYRVWTRKESYLKAIGLGLFRRLQEVTVPVSADSLDYDAEDTSRSQGLIQDQGGKGVWQVKDVAVWEGYSASICWENVGVDRLILEDLDILEMGDN